MFTGPKDGGVMVTSLRERQEKTGLCRLETVSTPRSLYFPVSGVPGTCLLIEGSVLISDQEGARGLAFLCQLAFPSSRSI